MGAKTPLVKKGHIRKRLLAKRLIMKATSWYYYFSEFLNIPWWWRIILQLAASARDVTISAIIHKQNNMHSLLLRRWWAETTFSQLFIIFCPRRLLLKSPKPSYRPWCMHMRPQTVWRCMSCYLVGMRTICIYIPLTERRVDNTPMG